MSNTMNEALANLAKPDEPAVPHAIVLTKTRVIRQAGFQYHVPAGSVIGLRNLSPSVVAAGNSTFDPGSDAKLIIAGDRKPGDIVAE